MKLFQNELLYKDKDLYLIKIYYSTWWWIKIKYIK